jgi:hypothetical protein
MSQRWRRCCGCSLLAVVLVSSATAELAPSSGTIATAAARHRLARPPVLPLPLLSARDKQLLLSIRGGGEHGSGSGWQQQGQLHQQHNPDPSAETSSSAAAKSSSPGWLKRLLSRPASDSRSLFCTHILATSIMIHVAVEAPTGYHGTRT